MGILTEGYLVLSPEEEVPQKCRDGQTIMMLEKNFICFEGHSIKRSLCGKTKFNCPELKYPKATTGLTSQMLNLESILIRSC